MVTPDRIPYTEETLGSPEETPDNQRVPQRFVQTMSGKKFVKYAGLVYVAHKMGLAGICVTILQKPTEENKWVCIYEATVTGKSGDTFIDIGDAGPKSCTKMIMPHLIRMASTRAKARALRDFTNIGMTAFEELGDDSAVVDTDNPL